MRSYFTSESVTEGHPDKVADRISDSILDAMLAEDPHSRVACETMVTTGLVVVAGEITSAARPDLVGVVRRTIDDIGYRSPEDGFAGQTCGVMVALDRQSPEIAAGVSASAELRDASQDPYDELGAGDQGMMFGFAVDETPSFMPMPIDLAHMLARRLAEVRKQGELPYLRPDGKTQVTVQYLDGRPERVSRVLISAQHQGDVDLEGTLIPDLWKQVVAQAVDPELLDDDTDFLVNPTGQFELGGPQADTGLTGRKIIVDSYGGMGRHGGGCFSGKDPTKVDRSGAYAARHAAKNIVAAGLATRCELQLSYAIGRARPFSVQLDTFGTSPVDPAKLEALVEEFFDFRPAAIIDRLELRRPIYAATSAYGHFGREEPEFTWEATDLADDLARAASDL
ncbi:MAG: methionine adenosyltransferase [Acidimicrobiia bacterium]